MLSLHASYYQNVHIRINKVSEQKFSFHNFEIILWISVVIWLHIVECLKFSPQ